MNIETLKLQQQISRTDIARLLKFIGKPGEKRDEKIAAVKELDRQNFQGIRLEDGLNSCEEF